MKIATLPPEKRPHIHNRFGYYASGVTWVIHLKPDGTVNVYEANEKTIAEMED